MTGKNVTKPGMSTITFWLHAYIPKATGCITDV